MFDLPTYGPAVAEILGSIENGQRLIPLAPGSSEEGGGLSTLRTTSQADIFDGNAVASPVFAACARSALFLYFSALDESHDLSQEIHTATGSFLHGIMHRQEPDYSNAKCWFRGTGEHELFSTLREEALRLRLRDESLQDQIRASSKWDPFWFVDCCQAHRSESDLLEIQRLEWQLIFDYTYRRALSG